MELFPDRQGDVYLLRAGAPAVVVRAPDDEDRQLLHRLAGGGVEAPPGSRLAARLAPLREAGLLLEVAAERELPEPLRRRFSRQLPWLAELGDPVALQLQLRRAHVVVVGCGGVGTWVLAAIASLGVGRFTVVDDDVVDPSNLNRQILYGAPDLGAPKAERAARWLQRFDPEIAICVVPTRVTGADAAAVLLDDASLLVLAADWPPYKLGRWVNEACVAKRVPFMTAGQQPPVLKVGPTYVPGRGPCFACHERRLAERFPLYPQLADHRQRHPPTATTIGPASGVVGTLLGLDALTLLTGSAVPATMGRAMLLDMHSLEQRWETIDRDPDCPVCRGVDSP